MLKTLNSIFSQIFISFLFKIIYKIKYLIKNILNNTNIIKDNKIFNLYKKKIIKIIYINYKFKR